MSSVWARLPASYRSQDATLGYPLRAYLGLVGNQYDAIDALIARIAPPTGRSALADPYTADETWLAWMAQLVGASLTGATTTGARRAAVDGAGSGWLAGTTAGIIAAVRSTLSDPLGGYVAVYRDPTDPFLLHVVTKATQTPDPGASLAAITASGAKPAGVILDWTAYAITWGAAAALTWNGIESLGSWDALEAYS